MLSRVAESMFWMGRYIERAENIASSLDVNFHLLLDLKKIVAQEPKTYWESLLMVASDIAHFHAAYDECDAATATEYLVLNRSNLNSIYSCIALARENARSMIESISSEMWEQVNNLYHSLHRATPEYIKNNPYQFYKDVKNGTQLFHGITEGTLPRNEGWDFLQAGRYLERTDNVARLLDVKYLLLNRPEERAGTAADAIQWMAVLKSCSALEAFRKVYLSNLDPDTILHFLLLDRDFPRSAYFSVSAMEQSLLRVSGNIDRRYTNSVDRLTGKLQSELSYLTTDEIYGQGLHDYLVQMQSKLAEIGDQIHYTYFAFHAPDTAALDFGTSGTATYQWIAGRAAWSQAQQQQQQQ